MDRQFSKDISQYKKAAWKGFSKEELAVILAALAAGCLLTYICVRYLGMSYDNAVYPGSIVVAPIIYCYFKKEKGIPLIRVILRKRQLKKENQKYPYKSSEMRMIEIEKELNQKEMLDEKKHKKGKGIIQNS